MHRMRLLTMLVLLALVIGCGGDSVKLPKAPVSGVVTYRGKPLSTGRIGFIHQSGQAASTDLATDGSYTLIAYQGKNEVVIQSLAPEKPAPDSSVGRIGLPRKESLIPARYSECATSGLTCEVKPSDNQADFALKD
jgi:hypothetical protein